MIVENGINMMAIFGAFLMVAGASTVYFLSYWVNGAFFSVVGWIVGASLGFLGLMILWDSIGWEL